MKKLVSGLIIGAVSITACSTISPTVKSPAFESPDAAKIIEKDKFGAAQTYVMPKGCISKDPAAIARGSFIFHNLNGKKAKKNPPAGLSRKQNGKAKQYGNCVACHNIEGAKGAGNIGPDLSSYREIFVDSGVRNMQFVYQKIADPRVDNVNTHMTVNLTTALFTEREICDITSYVVAKKNK
jgi:sulfur-oxidizing protein SoxX